MNASRGLFARWIGAGILLGQISLGKGSNAGGKSPMKIIEAKDKRKLSSFFFYVVDLLIFGVLNFLCPIIRTFIFQESTKISGGLI
jgi:hypothetical protein